MSVFLVPEKAWIVSRGLLLILAFRLATLSPRVESEIFERFANDQEGVETHVDAKGLLPLD